MVKCAMDRYLNPAESSKVEQSAYKIPLQDLILKQNIISLLNKKKRSNLDGQLHIISSSNIMLKFCVAENVYAGIGLIMSLRGKLKTVYVARFNKATGITAGL